MEHVKDDTNRTELGYGGGGRPRIDLFTKNSTWIDRGSNPVPRFGDPTNNCWSLGMAPKEGGIIENK